MSRVVIVCCLVYVIRLLLPFEYFEKGETDKPLPIPNVRHRRTTLERVGNEEPRKEGPESMVKKETILGKESEVNTDKVCIFWYSK